MSKFDAMYLLAELPDCEGTAVQTEIASVVCLQRALVLSSPIYTIQPVVKTG